ncbi:MAG TPA: hypothetical protein VNH53_05635 [Sphingomicrobium sp.]|nr:hypothetical protein [Sphingomicrobium sp.]
MTAKTQRSEEPLRPPEPQPAAILEESGGLESDFDRLQWEETRAEAEPAGAGGRAVLGTALILLAALWTAYTAWSAGRALGAEPLSSPAIAQWMAILAGPLALLGLAWIIFGRTRRKEAERFTRSVVAMRTEARSLEDLLGVLRVRLDDSQAAMAAMAQRLMQLGDETTGKLDGVTRDLDASGDRLAKHGANLDRAAESALRDIGVLLEDLPRAEATARTMAEQLRGAGTEAVDRAAAFEQQVGALTERTREADEMVATAAQRLVTHLTHIESAGAAAAARVGEAESGFSTAVDALLERTAAALTEIRSGVDAQSAAVSALVEQATAGIGRAGIEAADALGARLGTASGSLDGLSARVAEQERISQRMIADIDSGLSLIDQRFTELAAHGDERANHFLGSLSRARSELDALADQAGAQEGAIGSLAERTATLRDSLDRLSEEVREQLNAALAEAEGGASRVRQLTEETRPEIGWVRDAAVEASERMAQTGAAIGEQQDHLSALLASVDEGVGGAETRLAALSSAVADAQKQASELSAETAPALVAAMVQVREAAAHAAERAREAIAEVIPEGAANLSQATREALERAIREGIEERLREVDSAAAKAVEAARAASDRLTQQMLSLGQSAAALEQHFEQTSAEQREKDSEAFARRVALLIDSMNSAAIDVGKILADEVDEKAWDSYLKGNRGVFTRRAVKLLSGSENRAIRAHYEADGEFQRSVNRYVADFEAMLRRVLAERDGGMIAVTLMSSDMGKLYAALAQATDRRR